MGYVLKGRLCGFVCDECDEPLAAVTVRLLRPEADERLTARAVADPKETLAILTRFGVWSICGHLRTCKEGQPIPGALVTAFDADWLQDDPLGSATTDFGGKFLISYLRDDFEKTPLSPWGINFELIGGPDLY